MKSVERQLMATAIQPLAGSGGLQTPVVFLRDPYEILDDLMTVVEELCPVWPQRTIFSDRDVFRL
ncbi:MAG TPA: hypothetical protein VNI53_03205 [Gammaproteobacteria bacterium]|nr:hypothetical protein [Gammaproteobacteria bacterium]